MRGERAPLTEWLERIPRESNKAADGLATLALKKREMSMWTHGKARQLARTDVIGWTDAGIGTNGEVGLGWIVVERVKPWQTVAMGYVYQGSEEMTDGKDSSRE